MRHQVHALSDDSAVLLQLLGEDGTLVSIPLHPETAVRIGIELDREGSAMIARRRGLPADAHPPDTEAAAVSTP